MKPFTGEKEESNSTAEVTYFPALQYYSGWKCHPVPYLCILIPMLSLLYGITDSGRNAVTCYNMGGELEKNPKPSHYWAFSYVMKDFSLCKSAYQVLPEKTVQWTWADATHCKLLNPSGETRKNSEKFSTMQVTKHNSVPNFPIAFLSGSLAAHLQGSLWKSRVASQSLIMLQI